MLKTVLATTALGVFMATAAFAQSGADPVPATTEWQLTEGQSRVDVSAVSTEQLIGAKIESITGDDIGKVKDVILSDTGTVHELAASYGGFLGIGSDTTLLDISEVDFVKDANDTLIVRTTLTKDALKARPAYEAS